jgi:hypothetical protein
MLTKKDEKDRKSLKTHQKMTKGGRKALRSRKAMTEKDDRKVMVKKPVNLFNLSLFHISGINSIIAGYAEDYQLLYNFDSRCFYIDLLFPYLSKIRERKQREMLRKDALFYFDVNPRFYRSNKNEVKIVLNRM